MTVEEFGLLADAIKTYFPKDNMLPTEKAMDLWFDMLKDLEYGFASMALKNHIATSAFPPTIADIRKQYSIISNPEELNEMEAWSLVVNAMGNSLNNATEEFAKLPPLVQKAVGLPSQLREWGTTQDLNKEVIMSNFQRAYKIELQKQKELEKMPQNIRQFIEKVNVGSYPAQIEQKRREIIESANDRKNEEIKALEMKCDGVPMPEKYQSKIDKWKNKE